MILLGGLKLGNPERALSPFPAGFVLVRPIDMQLQGANIDLLPTTRVTVKPGLLPAFAFGIEAGQWGEISDLSYRDLRVWSLKAAREFPIFSLGSAAVHARN